MAPKHPKTIERRYQRDLLRRVRVIGRLVKKEIAELVDKDGEEIDALARSDSEAAIVRSIRRRIAGVRLAIEGDWREHKRETEDMLRATGEQLDLFEQREITKAWKSTVGVDPFFGSGEATKTAIRHFEAENLQLITKLQRETIAQLEDHLIEAARSGTPSKEFAAVVKSRLGVGESRARLIARDQIGSMSGKLAEIRQQDLGVTEYTWITSQDERVRPEHQERNGQVFAWSDPPEDGHPGQPIQCRCTASPVIKSLL